MAEYEQLQYPFDRQVEVRFNQEVNGMVADLVYLDGEPVPYQTSFTIDSDMDFRHLEFAALHMPSAQEIVVSGYVVPAELLNWYLRSRISSPDAAEYEDFKPEGFGGYFIEESEMQRITEMLNAQRDDEALGYALGGGMPGVPRPNTKLRVGV